MNKLSNNVQGIIFLVLAMFILSLQDIAIKWIGGAYPVLEIVLFRNLMALPCTLLLFRFEGGRGLPSTQRHVLEYLRGLLLFVSFTTYMMGLAALPLAEVGAIRNSAPLMITLLSVLLLGEVVGPCRWVALFIGFIGVLLIIRPGANTFNIGSVFILLTTLTYALNVIVTRQLRTTDSSATMAFYSTLIYLLAAAMLAPLTILIGEVPHAHPSLAFLLRAWARPTLIDLGIMFGLGLVWASGMYLIARAYTLAEASAAAPFEYVALLFSVLWGMTIWGEIPTWATYLGAFLTIASGLYLLYRERQERQ
ncbi:MAG: DMT family transporter [Deinococcales bacterium]